MGTRTRNSLLYFAGVLTSNWVSLFGASLVTISAFFIALFVFLAEMQMVHTAYLGILTFLVLPGIFVAGLILIPIGVMWEKRRRKNANIAAATSPYGPFPVIDFNSPRTRGTFRIVAVLTTINIFIVSFVSYKGVVYTETSEFCGTVCHTVMEPEFKAYENSPHSRVECVECHIGSGASWFVRAKVSGVRQVLGVMT